MHAKIGTLWLCALVALVLNLGGCSFIIDAILDDDRKCHHDGHHDGHHDHHGHSGPPRLASSKHLDLYKRR